MKLRDGGWQVNVEYFDNHVIKTPKTEGEISKKIFKHLKSKNKLHKLKDTVIKMQNDWENSIEFVKNSNIPLEHLAFPEFLEDEKIKQVKVQMIEDKLTLLIKENNLKEINNLARKIYEFIFVLWSYGFNEKTYKLGTEFGILDDEIVLIDFGELSVDKEKVEKQIKEKKWSGLKYLKKYTSEEVEKIFTELAEEMLTIEKLNEVWESKIK